MRNFWSIQFPLFDDNDGLGGVKGEHSDSDTALLDNLLDNKEKKEKEEVLEDKEDEEKEEEDLLDDVKDDKKDDEEDKKEEDEDLLDEIPSNRGVDLKKIKEKYPDFAKTNDFRELRNAYFRESKYTELFPTIDDAQEAAENNETFQKLNETLINQGDTTELLKAVKEASPKSFQKVATNFLDQLHTVDKEAWQGAISLVIKRAARDMQISGKRLLDRDNESVDGKALVATARNILLHYFDDDKVDLSEKKQDTELSAKEKDIQEREQKLEQEKWTSAYKTCETSVMRRIDDQIMQGLDPDNKLSDFTREALVEKIRAEVTNQISQDETHVKRMTSLWKRAAQSGYSRESLSRIVAAYLERARPIIPTVRNKFRSKATNERRTTSREDDSIRLPRRGTTGRAPNNDGKVNIKAIDPKKVDYSKTTDQDIFEGKVKVRG